MSDNVYLYGFVAPGSPTPPHALGGVHGAAIQRIDVNVDGVSAIVSHVPADEFSPAIIDANIQDLNWVGARGMEHERVVAWFVDHSDILPVSLLTLYSSETALQQDTAARADQLRAVMARVRDHREWDIKVSYDEEKLASHAGTVVDSIRIIDEEIATATPGKKFLLEKKRRDVLKRDLSAAARDRARALLEGLSGYAADVVTLPMPRNEGLPVVLNAAILVVKSNEAAMRVVANEQAAALEEFGIHVSLTGPWAPYRFMEAPDVDAV